MAPGQRDPQDYIYTLSYDRSAFQREYAAEFKGIPKYNSASVPDLLFVLGKIEQDPYISDIRSDIRWAAYMLATTFIESSHTVKVKRATADKKGHSKSHTVKLWRNFTPVEEAGHGKDRKYFLPVKIKRLQNGDARVTEYDGDQWTVAAGNGIGQALHNRQTLGAPADSSATAVYAGDDGDEHQYYGRGYVQLTWWSNYARTGVTLGLGLALLFDPDLVIVPDTAYLIMATGMRTGAGFANGRQLSQFFHGSHTDYVGARLMVNPNAPQENKEEVAKLAERFEKVLFASRIKSREVARR